jgi:hypothetical protein
LPGILSLSPLQKVKIPSDNEGGFGPALFAELAVIGAAAKERLSSSIVAVTMAKQWRSVGLTLDAGKKEHIG